ncbi:hypothetical protein D3C72_1220740 [compost metagenome]
MAPYLERPAGVLGVAADVLRRQRQLFQGRDLAVDAARAASHRARRRGAGHAGGAERGALPQPAGTRCRALVHHAARRSAPGRHRAVGLQAGPGAARCRRQAAPVRQPLARPRHRRAAAGRARDPRRRVPVPAAFRPALHAGQVGALDRRLLRHVHAGCHRQRRHHAPAHLCRLLHVPARQGPAILARCAQCAGGAGAAIPPDDHLHGAGHAAVHVYALGHRGRLPRRRARFPGRGDAASAASQRSGHARRAGKRGRHGGAGGAPLAGGRAAAHHREPAGRCQCHRGADPCRADHAGTRCVHA